MIMDSLFIIFITYLIYIKWFIYCQEDTLNLSSSTAETKYLTFDMNEYGIDGGNFSSPNFPNYYPRDTILFYKFIAPMNYRVLIEIDFFQVRGIPPQCRHDYLDVYINLTNFNFVNDQLLHRYCGRNKPPTLVSFKNLLLLGFFTEDTLTERGFNGTFRFIPSEKFKINLSREPCDYLFNSSISKRGELFSSTYPGTYLPWQFCNYSFVGLPDERVHIRFRDFMLFKAPNTQHCAIDLIKIYDNTLDSYELHRLLSNFRHPNNLNHDMLSEQTDQNHITDLCGIYPIPLDVYSTKSRLLLYFISTHYAELTDEEYGQYNYANNLLRRKGFYAEYEFISSITNLDFIMKSKSNQYVPGTECDQTIKSFGQGNGKIQSPNWPYLYKPQTSCSTYLLGVDDRYTLENVEIEFDQFDIDCYQASIVIYNASRINENYREKVDFKDNLTFCGHFKPEGRFLSRNALLKISFIPNDRLSNNVLPSLINGGKYQARYKFVKSYHQISADEYDKTNPLACNLSYYENRYDIGKFDLPRTSDNDYFANANCTFNFNLKNNKSRLLIWFEYFNIVDHNYRECLSDNLTYTYRFQTSSNYVLYPFIYCGYRNFPPPYLTTPLTKQFRIHFRSNNDSDTGFGFDGRYQYLNEANRLFSSTCPTPFDPAIHLNESEQSSGNISSNGYPENIICEWSYRTDEDLKFKLDLNLIDMEGSRTKDPPNGCQSSVLRIFSEGRIDELCGQEEKRFIITDSNWFTLQFISLIRQTKDPLNGFHISWTIIKLKRNSRNDQCSTSDQYFDCQDSKILTNGTPFCIHQSLTCDNYVHCQPISTNDENLSFCFKTSSTQHRFMSSLFTRKYFIPILVILIMLAVLTCIVFGFGFFYIKTKRRARIEQFDLSNNFYYYDRISEQDFNTINTIEQTVTSL